MFFVLGRRRLFYDGYPLVVARCPSYRVLRKVFLILVQKLLKEGNNFMGEINRLNRVKCKKNERKAKKEGGEWKGEKTQNP